MKDYLLAARAKIADPTNWTQKALARDSEGCNKPSKHPLAFNPHWEGIDGRDPRACQWCALGALQAVTPEGKDRPAMYALCKAARQLYETDRIATINDDLGHAAVLACYDKAIEAAQ
jgi:hypothetical protein